MTEKMIRHFLELAKKNNFASVVVEIPHVLHSQQNVFLREGFVRIGTTEIGDHIDIIMRKAL